MKPQIVILITLLITFGSFFLFSSFWPEPDKQDIAISSMHIFENPLQPNSGNVSATHLSQVEQLETYLRENPEDTTHLLRLARLYQDGHNPAAAAFYYERLLDIQPRQRQVWLDLANCFAENMQWEKALGATESMLEYYRDDAEGLYNLGAVHANMGNMEQAVAVWKQLGAETVKPEVRELALQSIARITALRE